MDSQEVPKAVLFSIDDVLFDHQHSLRAGLQAVKDTCYQLRSINIGELIQTYRLSLYEHLDEDLARQDAPCHEWTGFHPEMLAHYLGHGRLTPFCHKDYEETFKTAYRKTFNPVSKAVEIVMELKESGYKVGIVTRLPPAAQYGKLRRLGIANVVNIFYAPGLTGGHAIYSPDMFDYAAHDMGVNTSEILMVGRDPLQAGASLEALCKYVNFERGCAFATASVNGEVIFKNMEGLEDIEGILEEPHLINLRMSVEAADETPESMDNTDDQSAVDRHTPEPPPWSPLTPEAGSEAAGDVESEDGSAYQDSTEPLDSQVHTRFTTPDAEITTPPGQGSTKRKAKNEPTDSGMRSCLAQSPVRRQKIWDGSKWQSKFLGSLDTETSSEERSQESSEEASRRTCDEAALAGTANEEPSGEQPS